MASLFEQQMAAGGLPGLYAALGAASTYTPPDGSGAIDTGTDGAPLLVRVQREPPHEVDRPNKAAGENQNGILLVQMRQLAKPARGGRFNVDQAAEVWTIAVTPEAKNGEFICTCTRSGVERMMPRRARE